MATVTGKTSQKIDELFGNSIVSAVLNAAGQFTFTTKAGAVINAGSVSETVVNAVVNTAGRLIVTRRSGATFDAGFVGTIKPLDAWPVGSIFMGVSSANPAAALGGGTWVAWGSGRIPLGVNPGDLDFAAVEKTGGSKDVTLTPEQIPAHSHTIAHQHPMPHKHEPSNSVDSFVVSRPGSSANRATGAGWHASTTITTGEPSNPNTGDASVANSGSVGGGQSHSILQPYITCYMWKRTA